MIFSCAFTVREAATNSKFDRNKLTEIHICMSLPPSCIIHREKYGEYGGLIVFGESGDDNVDMMFEVVVLSALLQNKWTRHIHCL